MGGSLRNPASFCGVVGMRPSPGRIARSQGSDIFGMLGVEGPMARNVEDLALLFDAMVGEEIGDPVSLPFDGHSFLEATRSGRKPKRVAFSMDLGITHVDRQVRDVIEQAVETLASNGIIIENACPDLSEAHEVFDTLRALAFATGLGPFLKQHGDKLKPEVVWNIEKGLALSVEEIAHAKQMQATMFERMCKFFDTYDLLLAPSTIVPPFAIEDRYVEACDGHTFENYYQWLAIAYAITNVACPALSLPAGFTPSGLPVGLQIIGPPRGEAQILSSAKIFEDILGYCQLTPIEPRVRL
jgi:amidase